MSLRLSQNNEKAGGTGVSPVHFNNFSKQLLMSLWLTRKT